MPIARVRITLDYTLDLDEVMANLISDELTDEGIMKELSENYLEYIAPLLNETRLHVEGGPDDWNFEIDDIEGLEDEEGGDSPDVFDPEPLGIDYEGIGFDPYAGQELDDDPIDPYGWD